ncbi:MAG: hypothetical protein GAK28_00284 [Luteibacter sp.]|nr:MAG: hypothetical protein GAK28_00284 [Luteibacter sp.]
MQRHDLVAAMLVAPLALMSFSGHAVGGIPYQQTYVVAVPNGNFGGPAGDVHKHDDALLKFNLSPTHTIEDHIEPWTYRERMGGSHAKRHFVRPFELDKPGDLVFQTLDLGTPEVVYARAPKGVVYTVRASYGLPDDASSLKLRVLLRDENRHVLASSQVVANGSAEMEQKGEMKLEVNATPFPAAKSMTIVLENLSGRQFALHGVTLHRTVLTQPVVDFDFGD